MLPIILVIILILAACLLALGTLLSVVERDIDCFMGGAAMFIAISVFPLILLAGMVTHHANDLALVRMGHLSVEVREQAIKDIDEQLISLIGQSPVPALLNADTPVRSLIETKADFVKEIADARLKIAEAKISIAARKIGINSAIVKWMGEE